MGAVVWMLAAVAMLWLGLTHLIAVDSLLFTVTMMTAAIFGIKAAADAMDAIGAIGDKVAERRGDFDDD